MIARPASVFVTILTLAAACSNRSATTTPSNASGSAAMRDDRGRFVWQDLITDDVDACRRFYGSLFGWEFQERERLGKPYLLARKDGRFVAGMAQVARKKPDEPIAQWLSYVLVDDIDRALKEVERAGGKVLVAPVEISDRVRAAVVTDAEGAPLGLASFQGDLPFDPDAAGPGTFIWRDYLARDVEAALSFYRVFPGYEADRPSSAPTHPLFRRRGAGVRPVGGLVPIGEAPVRPSWLPYVRVDDPSALATRANELGGKVLLAPSASVRNGSLAIVADPSGAAVALQKWPL